MLTSVPVVRSVNLAVVRTLPRVGRTGIDKRPVQVPVRIEPGGVCGDSVLATAVHGGPDKAVYVYAAEDAAWWAAELHREIGPGAFGENLTTRGLEVTAAVVGERWRVGTALVEVAQPRIPCATFRTFWQLPDLIKRFTAAARPGAYLRVIEAGVVEQGDEITVLSRPEHGVTLGETFRAVSGETELVPHVLHAEELPGKMRGGLKRRLALSARAQLF